MQSTVSTTIILTCCLASCTDQATTIISEHEVASLPDTTPWHRTMTVAPDHAVMFEFEITTKGNGLLKFPGGFARIHDAHHDGITFEPSTLYARLADLDGDGFADIELAGTAVLGDERTDREIGRCPVRAVLLFRPATSTFIESVSSPMIYTSTEAPPPNSASHPTCRRVGGSQVVVFRRPKW